MPGIVLRSKLSIKTLAERCNALRCLAQGYKMTALRSSGALDIP